MDTSRLTTLVRRDANPSAVGTVVCRGLYGRRLPSGPSIQISRMPFRRVRIAEDVGFDFFGFGDHHTGSMSASSPTSPVTAATPRRAESSRAQRSVLSTRTRSESSTARHRGGARARPHRATVGRTFAPRALAWRVGVVSSARPRLCGPFAIDSSECCQGTSRMQAGAAICGFLYSSERFPL
jgi:hypothetical protein